MARRPPPAPPGRSGPLLLALALLATAAGCDAIVDRVAARFAAEAATRAAWVDDGRLHVVLCGTGSPLPSSERAGPCTAVLAGGHFVLVDAGSGANNRLGLLRLPRGRLDGILLTHFHSDHIADLGSLGMQSWALGRPHTLPVYGPPGVEEVVRGFETAYAQDTAYRVAHHGADLMDPAVRPLVAHPVPVVGDAAVEVFAADGLRVVAFRVDHAPVEPAYGYRFDYRGRSLVVSGDTALCPNLVKHARGADVLVHEALAAQLVARVRAAAEAAGNARLARILGDIPSYHTTPVQAAGVGARAGVRLVVLNHLVPPPDNFLLRRLFLEGVDEAGDVPVILGQDGLHLVLPPDSEAIERETL